MESPFSMSYLQCPNCGSTLEPKSSDNLLCTGCAESFDLVWGIPVFSSNRTYYYSPVGREWFIKALDEYKPRVEACPTAFAKLLREVVEKIPDNRRKQEWIDNLVAESRAFFKYLLPLNPDAHVLNLGSGWDNTTVNIARVCRRVTATDLTLQRIQLLKLKAAYYHLDNIDLVCGGDRKKLPFADETFDAVFLNGVLEWVASDWSEVKKKYRRLSKPLRLFAYYWEAITAANPKARQREYLKETYRVLKPGGHLYIGIENRFALGYFYRRPDHHSYLWFGSLYPRFIAHLVSLLRQFKPYLTYTYSGRGLKKLTAKAGFSEYKNYCIAPMYRTPESVFEIGSEFQVNQARSTKGRRNKLLPKKLFKLTVPSFGFIASKGTLGESWMRGLVGHFTGECGATPGSYHIARVCITVKDKLNIILHSVNGSVDAVVLKVPFRPAAERSLQANEQGLNCLRRRLDAQGGPDALRRLIPRAIGKYRYQGQGYFVETRQMGTRWGQLSARQDKELLNDLLPIMCQLGHLQFGEYSDERHQKAIESRLDFLKQFVPISEESLLGALKHLKEVVSESFRVDADRAFFYKGDFTLSNILCEAGRVCGLIDFDENEMTRFKLLNLADFLLSYCRHRHHLFGPDLLRLHLCEDYNKFPSDLEIRKWLALFEADAGDLKVAAIVSWINHVYNSLQWERVSLNHKTVDSLLLKGLRVISETQRLAPASR